MPQLLRQFAINSRGGANHQIGLRWFVSTQVLGRPKTFSLLTVVHIDELPWHSTILRRRGLRVAGRRRGPINDGLRAGYVACARRLSSALAAAPPLASNTTHIIRRCLIYTLCKSDTNFVVMAVGTVLIGQHSNDRHQREFNHLLQRLILDRTS
jgi:hypothetical protein